MFERSKDEAAGERFFERTISAREKRAEKAFAHHFEESYQMVEGHLDDHKKNNRPNMEHVVAQFADRVHYKIDRLGRDLLDIHTARLLGATLGEFFAIIDSGIASLYYVGGEETRVISCAQRLREKVGDFEPKLIGLSSLKNRIHEIRTQRKSKLTKQSRELLGKIERRFS